MSTRQAPQRKTLTQLNHRPFQYKQHFGIPTTTTPTVHSTIVVMSGLQQIIYKVMVILAFMKRKLFSFKYNRKLAF